MATLFGHAVQITGLTWDHTYVTSSDNYRWNCWGRSDGGRILCQGEGDSAVANCLAQHQPPDGNLLEECAGLEHYLIDGVCHQAANRILFPAGRIVDQAGGYSISSFLFGTYGRSAQEWITRKQRCEAQCNLGKEGSMDQKSNEPSGKLDLEFAKMENFVNRITALHDSERKTREASPESASSTNTLLGNEMQIYLDYKLNGVPKNMDQLLALQQEMLAELSHITQPAKSDADKREQEKKVGELMKKFTTRYKDVLDPDSYKTLFGEDK